MTEPANPNPLRWWTNRRRMGYIALYGIVGFGIAAMAVDLTEPQSDVISTVVWLLGAIVGCYIGGATWADIAKK